MPKRSNKSFFSPQSFIFYSTRYFLTFSASMPVNWRTASKLHFGKPLLIFQRKMRIGKNYSVRINADSIRLSRWFYQLPRVEREAKARYTSDVH
ncbi:hypothetical protein HMPREF0454_00697 [Hafnia alvei ATCC 51873]|uniref:Uncharacterized protein n=1 Tax=Hafnia alvei ATCC 51873 TaxID=1002364 RepID=G9Y286_HAFAL|nr:hypothetical protein HMPREF0454_00697 [Hafnia alvei ATCC 51873]